MELCHKNSILENPAIQRLGQFVREQHTQWNSGVPARKPRQCADAGGHFETEHGGQRGRNLAWSDLNHQAHPFVSQRLK